MKHNSKFSHLCFICENLWLKKNMRYIEPHATWSAARRMITNAWRSRVARRSANRRSGRASTAVRPPDFFDYFSQLTEHETEARRQVRPETFLLALHQFQGSRGRELAEEIIALIPKFIGRKNVLGIGEIGLNKNSRNELRVLEMQVELAAKFNQLILVHTPHLEDKLKGTRLILDVLKNDQRISPERVHH